MSSHLKFVSAFRAASRPVDAGRKSAISERSLVTTNAATTREISMASESELIENFEVRLRRKRGFLLAADWYGDETRDGRGGGIDVWKGLWARVAEEELRFEECEKLVARRECLVER